MCFSALRTKQTDRAESFRHSMHLGWNGGMSSNKSQRRSHRTGEMREDVWYSRTGKGQALEESRETERKKGGGVKGRKVIHSEILEVYRQKRGIGEEKRSDGGPGQREMVCVSWCVIPEETITQFAMVSSQS